LPLAALLPCSCQVCGARTLQPMVTPCGHLACLDCTAQYRTHCPLPECGQPYKMQAVDDPERFKTNPNPQFEVRRGQGCRGAVLSRDGEAAAFTLSNDWMVKQRLSH
jgi:hypothetical protein